MTVSHILPDLLPQGLVTLFCGSAAGAVSARRGLPYAGPGNKFWPILAETGLTPRRFAPGEYRMLGGLGIGITDINKTESGADSRLTGAGDDPWALHAKVVASRPALLAFTAKRPARLFFEALWGAPVAAYGEQPRRLGATEIHVLSSPSGLAVRWWDPVHWHRLAARHRARAASAERRS